MKKMKKILALALSLVMIMGMSMTAFATEGTPGDTNENVGETTPDTGDTSGVTTSTDPEFTGGEADGDGNYALTISNPVANHNYEIYQIFTGDVFDKNGTAVLSNIKYGSSYGATGNSLSDADVQLLNENMDDAIALAKYYNSENRLKGAYTTLTADKATAQVPAGYYLVKDVWAGSEPAEGTEQFSAYMVSIVGATTFTLKTITEPEFEKKSEDLEIVSDKKVGDEVPFQLKATLPADLDFNNFAKYTITFHDTLSEGLTFLDNSIGVSINGRPASVTDASLTFNGQNLDYTIENVIGWCGITAESAPGTVITIDYTATINNMAIARTGEKNEATLDYTNNPDGGQGSTPGDTVKVLLAQLVINKVDSNNAPLSGAGFTLYEYKEGALVDGEFDEIVYTADDFSQLAAISGDNQDVFTFGGLKEGKYILVESTTPDGYNTMEPKEIEITFTKEKEDGSVSAMAVTPADMGWVCTPDSDGLGGLATATIVNNAGLELPSTGGIGTTIFYVIGGIMVLGACVLLITKRRMKSRD